MVGLKYSDHFETDTLLIWLNLTGTSETVCSSSTKFCILIKFMSGKTMTQVSYLFFLLLSDLPDLHWRSEIRSFQGQDKGFLQNQAPSPWTKWTSQQDCGGVDECLGPLRPLWPWFRFDWSPFWLGFWGESLFFFDFLFFLFFESAATWGMFWFNGLFLSAASDSPGWGVAAVSAATEVTVLEDK